MVATHIVAGNTQSLTHALTIIMYPFLAHAVRCSVVRLPVVADLCSRGVLRHQLSGGLLMLPGV